MQDFYASAMHRVMVLCKSTAFLFAFADVECVEQILLVFTLLPVVAVCSDEAT